MLFRLSIDWASTLGRTVCFTQTSNKMLTSSQNTPTYTPRINVSPNIWPPHGPVKMAHKINHHSIHVFLKYTQRIPISDEGFTEVGRVKEVLANRGVLIFLAPRRPGPARHLSPSEPQAPPTRPERYRGVVSLLRQVPGGLSVHTLSSAVQPQGPPRSGFAALSTSPAPR